MATRKPKTTLQKLTKAQRKHLRETTDRPSIRALMENLRFQAEKGIVCWECRDIATRLGYNYITLKKEVPHA